MSQLEGYKPHNLARYPTECDVINAIKLFPTEYIEQIFDVIQSEVALKSKCI